MFVSSRVRENPETALAGTRSDCTAAAINILLASYLHVCWFAGASEHLQYEF